MQVTRVISTKVVFCCGLWFPSCESWSPLRCRLAVAVSHCGVLVWEGLAFRMTLFVSCASWATSRCSGYEPKSSDLVLLVVVVFFVCLSYRCLSSCAVLPFGGRTVLDFGLGSEHRVRHRCALFSAQGIPTRLFTSRCCPQYCLHQEETTIRD